MRWILVVCALSTFPPSALAREAHDPAKLARAALARFDFGSAKKFFEAALERGGLEPLELAEVRLDLGACAAALDDPRAAEAHFLVALAIRPDLRLAASASPKLTTPFFHALARWGDRPALRVSARLVRPPKASPVLRVLIVPADLEVLPARIQVHDEQGRALTPSKEGYVWEKGTSVGVLALDAHGNVMARGRLEQLPTARPRPPPEPSVADRWWVVAAATLAGATALGAIVVLSP